LKDEGMVLILQRMHSVLHIRGSEDEITVYHASFVDFLHDQSQSGAFFIDKEVYQQELVCCWLHVLSETDSYTLK
ncbi:hypothetical protein L218DRAFT_881043, partial [Marasmius fiardii PR-910]